MKYFEMIREKFTWVNLLLVGYWTSVISFVFTLVKMFYLYGFVTVPFEYEYLLFSSLVYAFVFRQCIYNYKVQEVFLKSNTQHNEFVDETVFIIEEMRNEIEQLKEKLGE